jgi:hypothetical protein
MKQTNRRVRQVPSRPQLKRDTLAALAARLPHLVEDGLCRLGTLSPPPA